MTGVADIQLGHIIVTRFMNDKVNLFLVTKYAKNDDTVTRRNIDKVSGFPDIVLGDIYYIYEKLEILIKFYKQISSCTEIQYPKFLKERGGWGVGYS